MHTNRPYRIAIFRTSRNLSACGRALRERYPDAELWLVTTVPGAGADAVPGLDSARIVVYDRSPFFRFWPWLSSAAFRTLRRRRFDRSVILYSNDEGIGYSHLKAIALTVSGTRVLVHRTDGSLVPWSPWTRVFRRIATAVVSAAGWSIIGLLILLPYQVGRLVRAARPARAGAR